MRCPYSNKKELVKWASERFNLTPSRFMKMRKSQLYAIFYNTGKKKEHKMIFLDVWEWVANLFFISISSLVLALSLLVWGMLVSMAKRALKW